MQGCSKIPITEGAQYLFIFPTSEAYVRTRGEVSVDLAGASTPSEI